MSIVHDKFVLPMPMQRRYYLLSFFLLIYTLAIASAETTKLIQLQGKNNQGFIFPVLELRGRVAEIFAFFDAEWISGLTCCISYNGKKSLPAKVFFAEFDEKGKQISKKVRLIYPKLNPGERGQATFRIHDGVARIVIWSEGAGPWEDPYC